MDRKSVVQALQLVGRPVFTTREIALLRNGALSATSHALSQLEKKSVIRRVKRGIWCMPSDPRFSPFSAVPFLLPGQRSYVSFLSALHLHGIIEQIPQIIYVATTGHGRIIRTSIGAYSFHQLSPEFFCGFDWYGKQQNFLIAAPEKALVDSFYLSSRKSRRFSTLPELNFGASFSFARARRWARSIPDKRIQGHVLKKIREISEGR